MKNKTKSALSSRILLGFTLIPLEFIFLLVLVLTLSSKWIYVYCATQILSFAVILWLVQKPGGAAAKIPWILIILYLSPFGAIFYLIWGDSPLNNTKRRQHVDRVQVDYDKAGLTPVELERVPNNLHFCRNAGYIQHVTGMPVWENTACKFYSVGEEKYADLMEDIRNAKKFIFLESFIIREGSMWTSILDVLVQKLKEGVDVRVLYDDIGCLFTLPAKYNEYLTSLGIKTACYNPFRPVITSSFNYRDHKKILLIDGNIGYTGGTNIGDEYINKVVRFGHWKDTDVRLEGDGVVNLTTSFLTLWEVAYGKKETDYYSYLPTKSCPSDGYVQFFDDSPLDKFNVGQNTIMQVINCAKNYVYIATPYLVLDNEMITALTTAAQSGVDVRILTPGIPDKNYIYCLTRSFYKQLVEGGVKIYEYTPGFIHAKMIVADDMVASVGTVNMDFRSFFLHFECGAFFYDGSIPHKVREDMLQCVEKSRRITLDWIRTAIPLSTQIKALFLRIFCPFL